VKHSYSNLVELLLARAERIPDKTAYIFLKDGEREEVNWNYGQLDARARAIAARLQAANAAGERVLLLYAPSLEFVAGFWGCLYAGAIAVPLYPPKMNRGFSRLKTVAEDCGATIALTSQQGLARMRPLSSTENQLPGVNWISTDNLPETDGAAWQKPKISGKATAFLQYTSGSTSTPKGVIVSHSNLLHNEKLIQRTFGQNEESIIVGWLPLYHDMGLIGNMLQPIYLGAQCILMSPAAFLQHPLRWLSAISHYKATTSGGPNMAYDLCVRKITEEELGRLDLSSWRVAFNGAEPVRARTLQAFAERFAPAGFRSRAFCPCYGLAEATLLVSGDAAGDELTLTRVDSDALANGMVHEASEPGTSTVLVGCGQIAKETEIKIVEPESRVPCSASQVGEIWVSSRSIAQGYWNRSEDTEQTFLARVAGKNKKTYLRTGDLGFIADGKVFVTGRLKDLIIIRGRNHYPQDIELTVETAHECLRPGSGAAFAVDAEGEERLVIVQEIADGFKSKAADVVSKIRQELSEQHEIQPYALILIRPFTIPKTSSGKIQRFACRKLFLEGSLDVCYEWRASTSEAEVQDEAATPNIELLRSATVDDVEQWLARKLAAKSGRSIPEVDIREPISNLALDSLAAIEIEHAIETELGVSISAVRFLQELSIRQLAAELLKSSLHKRSGIQATSEILEFPLSQGQRSLWFLHQLAPASTAYNLAFAVRINDLNSSGLRNVCETLIQRHASLRTTFHSVNGEPFQRVQASLPGFFSEIDASQLDEAALSLQKEANCQFNLVEGPLFRVVVFRSNADAIILLVVHHIVADFWSLALLMHELTLLYSAEVNGTSAPLPPLASYYSDFVSWQNELLAGEAGAELYRYWEKQLRDGLQVLNLPTDRPRPALQTFAGAAKDFKLSPGLTAKLKTLSQKNNSTLYMTLMAAFQVLLMRYSNQREFLVGSPTAARARAEWANLVGYFVNTLALRATISGNLTFNQLLQQVRATSLKAFEYQNYPFATLVEKLQPVRNASHSPIVQVMFAFEKTIFLQEEGIGAFALGEAGKRLVFNGVRVETVALPSQSAIFDLMLMMAEIKDSLSGAIQYNVELFEGETIERMAGHWESLLEAMVEAPESRIEELPMLSAAERRQMISEWNQTHMAPAGEKSLVELFEQQAERRPETTALVCGKQRLSYAALNQRANQLAHYLRKQGVGPESLVGVCMERSLEMVVAMLGILKAGGAYVPLDAAYPKERLAYMVEDTQAPAVVTEAALLGVLPGEMKSRIVCLDRDWDAISGEVGENPKVKMEAGNLAYLIYTSGSTGRAKAVMITHHSALVLCHWAREAYPEQELAGVLASTSICFDLSVFELFVPLSWGGTAMVVKNVLELGELEDRKGVTLINTVPSAMSELLRTGELPESVKVVNLAGEALSRELVQRLYARKHVSKVYNLYGPSEDTTYSTYGQVLGDEEIPSIGRPLANTEVYVLDEAFEPVPVGVAGEIYIAGEGLGRGYLGRPELTAEKFLPNPFREAGGGRFYRTGDLGRFRGNGQLEYLGRMDHQVKMRGYRIELGEIEAVLGGCGGVSESVVVMREDVAGDKRLVGYVVLEEGRTAEQVKKYLRERLPEYMVPGVLVEMKKLPLTPNGKLDRKGLPAPEYEQGQNYEGPRTGTEEVLAQLWAEVLKVKQVGVRDNFFDLGGHSLLATQLISHINDGFRIQLQLRELFEQPTVEALAKSVERELRGNILEDERPAITRRNPDERKRLSFAQQRLWFLDQLQPQSAFYNLPAAVLLEGEFNLSTFEWSLEKVVTRHEALRTRFALGPDGEPQQIVEPRIPISVSVISVTGNNDEEKWAEVHRLASEEAQKPFELTVAPLIRAQILKLGQRKCVALFTLHHIISDGWSHQVIQEELASFYAARTTGKLAAVAELDIQYGDYATWQREWLDGKTLEQHLEYWRNQLGDMMGVLQLPTDHSRPAIQNHRGKHRTYAMPSRIVDKLEKTARRENVTLFMLLLAGFQLLLSRYSGQKDIAVGTPIANRIKRETEKLIGFFVNTLVLRTRIAPTKTVRELLRAVRGMALEAYAHQDLPFEKLVQDLNPPRDLSRSPLFQAMLALQENSGAQFQLPGLKVEEIQVENNISKFDLFLNVARIHDGSLRGTWEYNVELFEGETIERMAGHWESLLEAMVEAPESRIEELPMLSAAERRQMISEWNQTHMAPAGEKSLVELFEQQAERRPETTALVCGKQRLSYAALNQRANQLAHYLRKQGVGPESLVGVCMERSLEMVVAMLGILKAGGAYVPLDAAYPKERLAYMVEDTQAPAVVTEAALLGVLPGEMKSRIVCLDRDWDAISGEVGENPKVKMEAGNLAYLIYTSGSTGRAKAVMITHHSALVLCHWAREAYPEQELAGVLASTSICFDLSVFELFVPLSWGGTAMVVKNVLELGELEDRKGVTLINTVPSAMSELLRTGELPESVKVVNLAGEALSRELVQRLYARKHVSKVYNLYGPSEDTTYSTYGQVLGDEEIPSIGRPLANTEVYVLDEAFEPVPVGVAGEIYIAGEGLGRGYLGRPELTAEKFLPNPFREAGGGRFYRTGDLGRFRGNGQLEYLGRMDHQVKMRGYRIELGEIEAVLGGCGGVSESVVVMREDVAGDKRLVGYVVLEEGRTAEQVKKYLRERLPEYMVPGVLVEMKKLPLTPNGKLDRKGLPAPEYEQGQNYEGPRTGTEEVLAQLWAEVLKVKQVGVRDNFFDLGGHSLLATQLISRLKEIFPIDLKVRALFEAPTIEGMARKIDESIPAAEPVIDLVPISRESHRIRVSINELATLPEKMQDR
jgi:amino acid adenylation domain-containing protein